MFLPKTFLSSKSNKNKSVSHTYSPSPANKSESRNPQRNSKYNSYAQS